MKNEDKKVVVALDEPTIGRVVWFWPYNDGKYAPAPYAATVSKINLPVVTTDPETGETTTTLSTINISYHAPSGVMGAHENVIFLRDDDAERPHVTSYAEWPTRDGRYRDRDKSQEVAGDPRLDPDYVAGVLRKAQDPATGTKPMISSNVAGVEDASGKTGVIDKSNR